MYHFRDSSGPVDLAFTDAELDLSLPEHGRPDTAADLARAVADFAPGAVVASMHQVHGRVVDVVDDLGPGDDLPDADALVTTRPDVVLVARAADCVPVLLADASYGVIGAAHAGRPGLAAGIVPETVARMRSLGAEAITAWVGPRICGGCYEVPAAMRDEVAAIVPAALATTTWGTPSLDIGAGVLAQLRDCEVTAHDVGACTRESANLFSYRRDGTSAGRLAGLVRIRNTSHEAARRAHASAGAAT